MVSKSEIGNDEDCQKGYPIELNEDNMSMASTIDTTASQYEKSNNHKVGGLAFKLKNDQTTYYYTGPVIFAENWFQIIQKDILAKDFQYCGPLVLQPNGHIWTPVLREILPGMNLLPDMDSSYERFNHQIHFPNPP